MDDDIREPDKPFMDILYENSEENNSDIELNLALELSNKDLNEELTKVIELSKNLYFDNVEKIVKEESIRLEEIRLLNIEKQFRIESLSNFCEIINRLNYSKEEIELKLFIKNILNEYFELKIDNILLDEDMYFKIYNLIDSYYLIPFTKKYKKTLISKNEDTFIRNIFLKK